MRHSWNNDLERSHALAHIGNRLRKNVEQTSDLAGPASRQNQEHGRIREPARGFL
jgi:hypothetical protein